MKGISSAILISFLMKPLMVLSTETSTIDIEEGGAGRYLRQKVQNQETEDEEVRTESFLLEKDTGMNTTIAREHDIGINIVGGIEAEPGEFPYYVDLGGCGGSLIAPSVVLTAAHCGNYKGDRILVGAYKAGKATNGAVFRKVVSQKKHPKYNSRTDKYDFMLLRLNSPVDLPTTLKLFVNRRKAKPTNGQALTVIGLGVLKEGGGAPNTLREVGVKAISTGECNKNSAYGGDVDNKSMFCAGVNGGGKDSCQGDSGGPIVIKNGKSHVQVGVVSWGFGCARERYPGVYARVSAAHFWIKKTVCDDWSADAYFCG